MKKSELKDYIKTRIRETLYAGPNSLAAAKTDPDYSKLKDKNKVDMTLKSGGSVELEEMARKASLFTIAPDFRELAADIQTGGPISPSKLADVLDFLEGKEMVTGPEIATGVGYEGKMPRIYPIFSALIDRGALTSASQEEEVEVPETPENEEVDNILDPEEEGPSDAEVEKVRTPIKMDPVSQTTAEFLTNNARLIQSIINNYKDSKIRIKEIREEEGDLSATDYRRAMQKTKESSIDKFAEKLDQLIELLKELEPAVKEKVLKDLAFKFNSVDANSITKQIAKKLGTEIASTEPVEISADINIEDIDDEELMEDSGVEDVDYGGDDTKAYDSVYERMQKLINYKG